MTQTNKKKLILDGYNVIYKIPALTAKLKDSLAASRDTLAQYLLDWKRFHPNYDISVIFDGRDSISLNYSHTNLKGIDCYFTKSNVEADDRIISIIKNINNKNDIIVISDDNKIRNHCRSYKVAMEHPSFFIKKDLTKSKQINNDKNVIDPKDVSEINKWYEEELKKRTEA